MAGPYCCCNCRLYRFLSRNKTHTSSRTRAKQIQRRSTPPITARNYVPTYDAPIQRIMYLLLYQRRIMVSQFTGLRPCLPVVGDKLLENRVRQSDSLVYRCSRSTIRFMKCACCLLRIRTASLVAALHSFIICFAVSKTTKLLSPITRSP